MFMMLFVLVKTHMFYSHIYDEETKSIFTLKTQHVIFKGMLKIRRGQIRKSKITDRT